MKKTLLKNSNMSYRRANPSIFSSRAKFSISHITYSKTDKEQIEEAEQSVSKQKSKKKKIWNTIFFIINLVVVAAILAYQLTQENITSFSELSNLKIYYLAVLFGVFAFIMFLDAHRTNCFLKRSGNRSRPFLCFKMCAIGRYYDNITPMSSGGEPSQIFYMSHRGLDASSSISVPMARYVVSQMSWIIVGIVAVICIIVTGVMDISAVLVIGLVGFLVNFFMLSLSLTLSMSKKIGNTLVVKVLRLLQKMRIIKNYEKQYDRVMKVVEGYQKTMKTYAKNKLFFLYTLLVSILIFILTYTMPFLIYLMFGGTDYTLWGTMLIYCVMIDLGASIIPIPGGTGMNEISFTFVFTSLFPEGTVFWGLLFWRFMTYYIYILQGVGIVIYDYAYGNKKYRWLEKKWKLEKESISFQEEQIRKYKREQRKRKNSLK